MLKRYPIRVLKYFLFLVALFVILFGVMLIFNWSSWNMFLAVWKTEKIWILLLLFVGFPLAYPFAGYTARDVRGNLGDQRQIIERVLVMSGFRITEDKPDKIVAHADKTVKKIAMKFEDRIEIRSEGNHFVRIEGARREVVKIENRIRSLMNL